MESPQRIRSRLKAVKNVSTITKAMEVVSATKMRKSQEMALATRPYAFHALSVLSRLGVIAPDQTLWTKKGLGASVLLVLVASDRGLAGSFNSQILKKAEEFLAMHSSVEIIAVGKKALVFAEKKRLKIVDSYTGFGDFAEFSEMEPLMDEILNGFENGSWQSVFTLSMNFKSTLRQVVISRQILPASHERIMETVHEIVPEHGRYSELTRMGMGNQTPLSSENYILEPNAKTLLSTLLPFLVRMQIFQSVLEANASEHSARMVAMKTASDNAEKLLTGLRLEYNKVRQSLITKEMIEIVSTGGALAS